MKWFRQNFHQFQIHGSGPLRMRCLLRSQMVSIFSHLTKITVSPCFQPSISGTDLWIQKVPDLFLKRHSRKPWLVAAQKMEI